MLNTLKFVKNCLAVFDHFVELKLKGLTKIGYNAINREMVCDAFISRTVKQSEFPQFKLG